MKVNFDHLRKNKSFPDKEIQCFKMHYLCENQATYFLALTVAEIWMFNQSGKDLTAFHSSEFCRKCLEEAISQPGAGRYRGLLYFSKQALSDIKGR